MKMIFKKDVKNNNEIIAFMPYDFVNWQGEFTCYAHIGQHSQTNYAYYLQCKPATYNEYKDLLQELKQIGYDVQVINRINGKLFRQKYNEFLEHEKVLSYKENIA